MGGGEIKKQMLILNVHRVFRILEFFDFSY